MSKKTITAIIAGLAAVSLLCCGGFGGWCLIAGPSTLAKLIPDAWFR